MAVHRERSVEGTRERIDFVVFHKEGKFGIDVFYPTNLTSLRNCVNIKQKKYKNFKHPLYFVCTNPAFNTEDIKDIQEKKTIPKDIQEKKTIPLDALVHLLSEEAMGQEITAYKTLAIL